MIDIKFLRTEPDRVRENIRKKFQDEKLPLVDEIIALDKEVRDAQKRMLCFIAGLLYGEQGRGGACDPDRKQYDAHAFADARERRNP